MTTEIKPEIPMADLAQNLYRRRLRLLYLNLALLLVPALVGVVFLRYGRSDRVYLQKEIDEEVRPIQANYDSLKPKIERITAVIEARPDLFTTPLPGGTGTPEISAPPIEKADGKDGASPTDVDTNSPTAEERREAEQQAQREAMEAFRQQLESLRSEIEVKIAALDMRLQPIESANALVRLGQVEQRAEGISSELTTAEQRLRTRIDRQAQDLRGHVSQTQQRLRTDIISEIAQDRNALEGRVRALEGQIPALRQEITSLREEIMQNQRDASQKSELQFSGVRQRLDFIERAAFRSTLVKEKEGTLIPGLGFLVRLGGLEREGTVLDGVVIVDSASGRQIYPGSPSQAPVSLNKKVPFSHEGCDHDFTVRRVAKIPLFRDYLEVVVERKCPTRR